MRLAHLLVLVALWLHLPLLELPPFMLVAEAAEVITQRVLEATEVAVLARLAYLAHRLRVQMALLTLVVEEEVVLII
jgi:hypothetical protein